MQSAKAIKQDGQVFTPPATVNLMLDICGYDFPARILQKHIMENSCGEGAFLCEIVKRYCTAFFQTSKDTDKLKNELETYIHGIEINKESHANCLYNLGKIVETFGIEDVHWDIPNTDALECETFDASMDYVVGNPPYVRVHNLSERYDGVKKLSFTLSGMTDLYLAFFEKSFQMLKPDGKLCYITPSSWLNSLAGVNLRSYILKQRNLASITDFEHFQVFDKINTYSSIALFDQKHASEYFDYYRFEAETKSVKKIETIGLRDCHIENAFYLSDTRSLRKLKAIKQAENKERYAVVKNGFATLADGVFIGSIPFEQYTIDIIKASTGKWQKAFYPYDEAGKPLPKAELFAEEAIREYMNAHKEELLKGKSEEEKPLWYLYGRTQALKDVSCDKISINTIIKDKESLKIHPVERGCGVYSGLYILTKVPYEDICSILKSDDFLQYVKALKKYKSGGYYTFNTKDLEQYLNYTINKISNETNRSYNPIDERKFYQCNIKFV